MTQTKTPVGMLFFREVGGMLLSSWKFTSSSLHSHSRIGSCWHWFWKVDIVNIDTFCRIWVSARHCCGALLFEDFDDMNFYFNWSRVHALVQNVSDSVVSYSFPKKEALVCPKLSKKVIDSCLPSFLFCYNRDTLFNLVNILGFGMQNRYFWMQNGTRQTPNRVFSSTHGKFRKILCYLKYYHDYRYITIA